MKAYITEHKKQFIIAVIALILVLAGAGIAVASNQPLPAETSNSEVTTTTVSEKTSVNANVTFDLDGFDWSMPVLLSVTDGNNKTTYVAYSSPDNAKLTLDDGTYTVAGISPVTAESCIYITSDPFIVDKTTETVAITGVKLPAEDVTDEQINAIKDAYTKAKEAGVVGDAVTTLVDNNVNAGAEARASKSDEEKAEAAESAKSEATAKQEQTASNNGSNGNSASASNGNSSDNNSGNSSDPSSHTHSWSPVYRTVHHDAVTHEEPVYTEKRVCTVYCTKHQVPYVSQAVYDADPDRIGYCSADKYCTANSTNIYNTERIQTGTKTVTDKAAYDEQVVDHYTCSCGATK